MKPGKRFLVVVSAGLVLLVVFLSSVGTGKIEIDSLQGKGQGPRSQELAGSSAQ